MTAPHGTDERPDAAAAAIIAALQEQGGRVILTFRDFEPTYTSVLLRGGNRVCSAATQH